MKNNAEFHDQYFRAAVHDHTHFLGVPIVKPVSDIWSYQELLFEMKPVLIVEMGVWCGGFVLFMDMLCGYALPETKILAVDIERRRIVPEVSSKPRIQFLHASTLSPVFRDTVLALREQHPGPVLFSLDDNHHAPHVLAELHVLEELTRTGDYLVVEDTNIAPHLRPKFGPGPGEALQEYLDGHPGVYELDVARETKFGFTYFPGGWLKRL